MTFKGKMLANNEEFVSSPKILESAIVEVCLYTTDRTAEKGVKAGKYVIGVMSNDGSISEYMQATEWNLGWPSTMTACPFDKNETLSFDNSREARRMMLRIDTKENLAVCQVLKQNGIYTIEHPKTKERISV